MFRIWAVVSVVGPEITASVATLDDVSRWIKEHRPEFGYWDCSVVDPEGKTVPDSLYMK